MGSKKRGLSLHHKSDEISNSHERMGGVGGSFVTGLLKVSSGLQPVAMTELPNGT